ncbi:MAG: RICIN domain-containing protein [Melioribacteraceae bacterium]|nr:RICIN domain-containing protein [Melioribacteraceae bacterium]
MKKLIVSILLLLSTNTFAQFTGGTVNNLMNLGDEQSLELIPGTKMSKEEKLADDLVGDLFGQAGLDTKTNENPIITVSNFMDRPGQTWYLSKVNDGEFVIYNEAHKMVLGIDGASNKDKAKIVPQSYVEGNPSQIFAIQRDTVKYRYGFYLISKQSKLALQVDKEKKEIYQTKFDEGNAYQVWVMALRKTFVNSASGKYMTPDKSTIFFPGGLITATANRKSIYNNWDFIVHPTGSGIFYVRNTFSKKFLSVAKNDAGSLLLGEAVKQMSYNRNAQLLFEFDTVEGSDDYIFYCYPGKQAAFTVDGDALKTVRADTTQQAQYWRLEKANFSLF